MKRWLFLLLLASSGARADAVFTVEPQTCLDGARSGIDAERAVLACTTVLDSGSVHAERVADYVAARADNFVRLGRFENALADYDRALARSPSDASLYRRRCKARAIWRRELFAALTDCDTALQMAPGDRDVLGVRALVYFRRADYADALADLGTAKRDAPSLYLRGLAKGRSGDAAGAAADIEAAKAIDADIADTYAKYGVTP